MGRADVSDSRIRKQVEAAQQHLHKLLSNFDLKLPWGKDLVAHTPRADNSAADAAANRALDNRTFSTWDLQECLNFLDALARRPRTDYALLWSFDGASRGNPGQASFGVSAWWGTLDAKGFHQGGHVFSQGVAIGKAGNNLAEAVGLSAACKASCACTAGFGSMCRAKF